MRMGVDFHQERLVGNDHKDQEYFYILGLFFPLNKELGVSFYSHWGDQISMSEAWQH